MTMLSCLLNYSSILLHGWPESVLVCFSLKRAVTKKKDVCTICDAIKYLFLHKMLVKVFIVYFSAIFFF